MTEETNTPKKSDELACSDAYSRAGELFGLLHHKLSIGRLVMSTTIEGAIEYSLHFTIKGQTYGLARQVSLRELWSMRFVDSFADSLSTRWLEEIKRIT